MSQKLRDQLLRLGEKFILAPRSAYGCLVRVVRDVRLCVRAHRQILAVATTGMARNIEIKARIPGLDAIRAKALSMASEPSETLQQTDTFFAVPEGRLKVREFSDGTGELISYHRPNTLGPKQSVYTRYACQNAKALCETLSRVLPVRGAVVKRREVFLVGQTRVHLDEVEGLGPFVELEVILGDGEPPEHGERVARELLHALDIPETSLIAEAYIDLLERRTTDDRASIPQ